MQTLKEIKAAYKSGRETLLPDEYLGDDGLPHCKKCKGIRVFVSDDEMWCMHMACECQQEAARKEREEEERVRFMEEFHSRKKLSLLGERYSEAFFKKAKITEHNREAFEKARNYVEHFDEVLKHNIGLYIYGDNSSGKTFLTACMCNELVWRKNFCVYTNLASILNEIRASYDGQGDGECAVLNRLRGYDFAFLDDLGKEFIGREFRPESSKWAEEKLFEILNERYNAQKPTIFSSNYSIEELYTVLGLDKAIVERINEMSTRVIKLEGDDFRSMIGKEKSEIAKKLGI